MKSKNPSRTCLASGLLKLACLAAVTIHTPITWAGEATLQVGSSPAGTNLTGSGFPLDSRFRFEIGTFDPGFTPSPLNILDWINHWYPLTDAQGKALDEATITYNDSALGYPFSPDALANQFSINVTLAHNLFPFSPGRSVYIWGFDRRQGGGNVEWILIRNPAWIWPTIDTATEPIIRTFDVSHPDSFAIIGQVNMSGVEMRTATVTLSTPLTSYDAWLADHFTEAEIGDPALEATRWGFLADADGDTIPNGVEFATGTGPLSAASAPAMEVTRSGNLLTLTFTRRKNMEHIVAEAQWCGDLTQWTTSGITEVVIDDLGDFERIEASVIVSTGTRAFMRLSAGDLGEAG